MKNIFKFIGIITLTTLIGFSMAACEEAAEDEVAGELIIGFFTPDFDGKFVKAEGIIAEDTSTTPVTPAILLIAADSYTAGKSAKLGVIRNNSVALSIWNVNGDTFSGDSDVELTIYVYSSANDAEPESLATVSAVSFVSGKSTVELTGVTFDSYIP